MWSIPLKAFLHILRHPSCFLEILIWELSAAALGIPEVGSVEIRTIHLIVGGQSLGLPTPRHKYVIRKYWGNEADKRHATCFVASHSLNNNTAITKCEWLLDPRGKRNCVRKALNRTHRALVNYKNCAKRSEDFWHTADLMVSTQMDHPIAYVCVLVISPHTMKSGNIMKIK